MGPGQAELLSLLGQVAGKKSLLVDKTLSPLISSLAPFSLLQEHGAESVQWLDATAFSTKVLVICRPTLDCAAQVCRIAAMPGKQVTLILVPRQTLQFDEAIQSVSASIDICILPVHHYQVEQDLIMIDGDHVYNAAVSLVELQQEYGLLHRLLGKGIAAQQLASLLTQLRADVAIEQKQEIEPGTLGDCIMMDRQTDLLTPMLTQLTYEGLLRETFTPAELQGKMNDDIFYDLRGDNFSKVGPKLSGKASTLAADFDERHGAKTTSALKAFVSKIPTLQGSQKQLKTHVELAEALMQRTRSPEFRRVLELEQSIYSGEPEASIVQALELLIARQAPLPAVLRLLCCWSLVHNGIKAAQHDFFVQRLAQAYGYQVTLTVQRLAHQGMLVVRSPAADRGRGSWLSFSRSWNLLTDNDEVDLGQLYSGYIPLSLRIFQGLVNYSAVDKFETLYKALHGPSVSINQSTGRAHAEDVMVVVFLGGCTATELAGVRLLAHRMDREVLILTSKIVTANEMLV
ncbi:Sec1-like protein [Protomyces lactucae-debilis]|uniref:Sec1-like protein n=1 Tax=Protomyces lactucae-debilis TaxID=2754530 RepID=A0A1Y2FK44_PROLT|nr:Sec1-like protein [Protomyces lactucae-debilis]ORY83744.1 Sec1-like protein [Protomyces lactucae-debilis]